jgi:hypothetical protein
MRHRAMPPSAWVNQRGVWLFTGFLLADINPVWNINFQNYLILIFVDTQSVFVARRRQREQARG